MDHIVNLIIILRFLRVPLKKKSHIFGDNTHVVDSSMTPHSRSHKRYVAFSFHRARETSVAGVTYYCFIQDSYVLEMRFCGVI